MKVDKTGVWWRPSVYQQQQETSAKPYKVSQGKDQVQISEQAKTLLTERSQNTSSSERTDTERIKRLRQEIANGSYRVDAREVAERLYHFWFGR